MTIHRSLKGIITCCSVLALAPGMRAQDHAAKAPYLVVAGSVTNGDDKFPGVDVVLYKGNEVVSTVQTSRSGTFKLKVQIHALYTLVFRKEGTISKLAIIDTRIPGYAVGGPVKLSPLDLSVSLIGRDRYGSTSTDDLDFPFAMVAYNRVTGKFQQDMDYTMSMQRVNGALLLMAAGSKDQ